MYLINNVRVNNIGIWCHESIKFELSMLLLTVQIQIPIMLSVVFPKVLLLDPLLFILYMNDICRVSKLVFTLLYADDTCVLLSGKDLNNLIAVLNVELISLSVWLKSNNLSLNTQKTFFMVFHRARLKTANCNDLVIDNASITRVNSVKYLGIIIDVKFNWIEHII